MDIQPASIDQVQAGRDGKVHVVTSDTGNVAAQLRQIDPSLVLHYHEATRDHSDYYAVSQELDNGDEHLVTTCRPVAGGVDPRIVERVCKITQPGYDVVAEITALNEQVDADRAHQLEEQVGERAERAYHRFCRETGTQNRVFVPRDVG